MKACNACSLLKPVSGTCKACRGILSGEAEVAKVLPLPESPHQAAIAHPSL